MAELVQKTAPDYGTGLTWFLKDPRFGNVVMQYSLLILSCIFIIPIFYVVPLMTGYVVATIRNIQNGKYELPEIQSSEQWKDGLMLVLVNFVVGAVVALLSGGIMMFLRLAIRYESSSDFHMMSAMATMLMSFINVVSNLVLVLVEMFVTVVYAKTRSLNELVNFENYKSVVQANGVPTIVIVLVLHSVASSIITMLGLLLCCIGVLPAAVVVTFVTAGLYGQLSTQGVAVSVE